MDKRKWLSEDISFFKQEEQFQCSFSVEMIKKKSDWPQIIFFFQIERAVLVRFQCWIDRKRVIDPG